MGPGALSVLREQGGSGSVPTPPLASPDLSLLQCSLELALLAFQGLLGFLQFLDALPTEADMVCEVTDLLCKVNKALRGHVIAHAPTQATSFTPSSGRLVQVLPTTPVQLLDPGLGRTL